MSVDHWGGLCDRWRDWLGETGCWWSSQLCLTVACCFSALSFASSSCFCKAAWRDFISSLSSESEVRNTLLAHPPYTLGGLHCWGTEWLSSMYRCWEPFCTGTDSLKAIYTHISGEPMSEKRGKTQGSRVANCYKHEIKFLPGFAPHTKQFICRLKLLCQGSQM